MTERRRRGIETRRGAVARGNKIKATRATVLERLASLANPDNVAGMARYGIDPTNTLGVSVPALRSMARDIGKDHELALDLWESEVHEARILACLIDEPALVTEEQMERWVKAFNSWDIVDGVCSNLFDKTSYARAKAVEWSGRKREFEKRAGFVLMAALAVHDKKAPDSLFKKFLPIIEREAGDERNFVRKAVNWALRQIGKRNVALNGAAIAVARRIKRIESPAARWVASDALRELEGDAVQKRLKR